MTSKSWRCKFRVERNYEHTCKKKQSIVHPLFYSQLRKKQNETSNSSLRLSAKFNLDKSPLSSAQKPAKVTKPLPPSARVKSRYLPDFSKNRKSTGPITIPMSQILNNIQRTPARNKQVQTPTPVARPAPTPKARPAVRAAPTPKSHATPIRPTQTPTPATKPAPTRSSKAVTSRPTTTPARQQISQQNAQWPRRAPLATPSRSQAQSKPIEQAPPKPMRTPRVKTAPVPVTPATATKKVQVIPPKSEQRKQQLVDWREQRERFRKARLKRQSADNSASEPKLPSSNPLASMLNKAIELMQKRDRAACDEMFEEIVDKFNTQALSSAYYWICRAYCEEELGDNSSVVRIYEQAFKHKAQPHDKLDKAFKQYMMWLIEKDESEQQPLMNSKRLSEKFQLFKEQSFSGLSTSGVATTPERSTFNSSAISPVSSRSERNASVHDDIHAISEVVDNNYNYSTFSHAADEMDTNDDEDSLEEAQEEREETVPVEKEELDQEIEATEEQDDSSEEEDEEEPQQEVVVKPTPKKTPAKTPQKTPIVIRIETPVRSPIMTRSKTPRRGENVEQLVSQPTPKEASRQLESSDDEDEEDDEMAMSPPKSLTPRRSLATPSRSSFVSGTPARVPQSEQKEDEDEDEEMRMTPEKPKTPRPSIATPKRQSIVSGTPSRVLFSTINNMDTSVEGVHDTTPETIEQEQEVIQTQKTPQPLPKAPQIQEVESDSEEEEEQEENDELSVDDEIEEEEVEFEESSEEESDDEHPEDLQVVPEMPSISEDLLREISMEFPDIEPTTKSTPERRRSSVYSKRSFTTSQIQNMLEEDEDTMQTTDEQDEDSSSDEDDDLDEDERNTNYVKQAVLEQQRSINNSIRSTRSSLSNHSLNETANSNGQRDSHNETDIVFNLSQNQPEPSPHNSSSSTISAMSPDTPPSHDDTEEDTNESRYIEPIVTPIRTRRSRGTTPMSSVRQRRRVSVKIVDDVSNEEPEVSEEPTHEAPATQQEEEEPVVEEPVVEPEPEPVVEQPANEEEQIQWTDATEYVKIPLTTEQRQSLGVENNFVLTPKKFIESMDRRASLVITPQKANVSTPRSILKKTPTRSAKKITIADDEEYITRKTADDSDVDSMYDDSDDEVTTPNRSNKSVTFSMSDDEEDAPLQTQRRRISLNLFNQSIFVDLGTVDMTFLPNQTIIDDDESYGSPNDTFVAENATPRKSKKYTRTNLMQMDHSRYGRVDVLVPAVEKKKKLSTPSAVFSPNIKRRSKRNEGQNAPNKQVSSVLRKNRSRQ
jgi:hypothetical protein